MTARNNPVHLPGRDGEVVIRRNGFGIPEITAFSYRDCSFGLGWVHANDRQFRMMLSRIIFEGRSAELINSREDLLQADKYIRSLDLYPDINKQKQLLEKDVRESSESYAEGVNALLDKKGISPDLKFLKSPPEPWKIEDTMRFAKLFFSFRAIESQAGLKKHIIRMIRDGLDEKKLKELFPVINDTIDVELIKKITLLQVPSKSVMRWISCIPAFISGSVWAVSGRNAAGGKPMLCAGPHLEISMIPSVWHEVVLRIPDDTIKGFTIPGIPCVIMGRNRTLAFSGINSFTDITEFRIEECRNGKYRRGDIWHHFDVRREFIKTKNGESIKAEFFENEHGVLEGDPFTDGFYIVRNWSAWKNCGARDLNVLHNVMRSKTVREAMRHYRDLDAVVFDFVMADISGNIGRQMSGRMYNRSAGSCGLLPLPAWDRKYDLRGFILKNRLASSYNPSDGIIISADNNMDYAAEPNSGKPSAVPYRYKRIRDMLKNRKKSDAEYMKEIHYDLSSIQAERFMKEIFPFADFRKKGRILKEWNMEYRPDSEGASIFENIYESMTEALFWGNGSEKYGLKELFDDPYIFSGYYANIDNIILNRNSCWFNSYSWEQFMKLSIESGLKRKYFRYGKKRGIHFRHVFFKDKIFSTRRFDYGLFELPGGRATVNQCLMFKTDNRNTATGASFRIIADMADGFLLTNAAGDNCDSPFPGMYKNNNKDWIKGIYKKLT